MANVPTKINKFHLRLCPWAPKPSLGEHPMNAWIQGGFNPFLPIKIQVVHSSFLLLGGPLLLLFPPPFVLSHGGAGAISQLFGGQLMEEDVRDQ